MVRRLELLISSTLVGQDVDTLLRKQLGLSGSMVRRVKFLEDGILVDGQRVNTRFFPKEGQQLSVRLSDIQPSMDTVPREGPLDIVYEDPDVIVLNKQAGVPVHIGLGHYDDTLGNFLMHHYQQTGQVCDFHPIHRLDRGTSGLLVVAKHPHAQERLKQQLHTPDFVRSYLAICEGNVSPEQGTICMPIGRKEGSLVEHCVRPDGKYACTHYHVQKSNGSYSLVELQLETGRTHQIRVHMAYLGHPLVGDFLYGTENPSLIARPALHSWKLSFLHPIFHTLLSFQSPLPSDFLNFMKKNISKNT